MKITQKTYRKYLAVTLSFLFSFNQISPVSYAFTAPVEKDYIPSESNTPTKSADDISASSISVPAPGMETTQDFLESELTLEKISEESTEQQDTPSYEVPEYSYEDAAAHLTSDYAAAVIVNSLTAENLKDLVSKNIEVGIAIIEGKIVLYTSGNNEEIRVNPAVNELLTKSTLNAHTHPDGHSAQPSLYDIEAAGEAVEYTIGDQGVFAYNQDGLTTEQALSYQSLINEINKRHDSEASTYETRQILHKFIEEIDAYNQDPTNAEKLRSAGPTIFANQPRLSSFDSTVPPANFAVSQLTDPTQTDKRIRIVRATYNTTNGSFAGATMDFSSAPVNLSAVSTFSFDFRTDNNTAASCSGGSNCIKVEFKDTSGRAAAVNVRNLNSVFQQKDITRAILDSSNNQVDYTSIAQIHFIIDHGMVAGKNNGFFEVRTGGLYFQPTFTAGGGTASNLAGYQAVASPVEPAGRDTVTNFTQVSDGQFNFTYNLGNGADADFSRWGGSVISFGTPYNLNTQSLILNVKASGTTKIKFDVVSGTGANAKVTSVIATGVSSATAQNYTISKTLLDQAATPGFDASNITAVFIVVDDTNAGSKTATGTVEIAAANFVTNYSIAPDATNPAITTVPNTSTGARPALTAFSSFDPSVNDYSDASLSMFSQTFGQLNFNTYNTTSYAGAFFNYDNPATDDGFIATTGDIETINLSTAFPNGIVLGLDHGGTGLTEVILEVTDNTGKKDSVTLTGIAATGQRWKIAAAKFDAVDISKIQSIAIVSAGRHVGARLNIDWGNFFFVPPIPADGSNPAITPAPTASWDQDKPALVGFASFNGTNDFSNSVVTPVSGTFQQIDMNLYNTFSYGGAFVNYDNPATTPAVETVNFTTVFPSGIVLGLDNGGTDITQVKLEVTDNTGKKDAVFLTGIGTTGKRWKILTSQFDEVDMTKIQSFSLVVEGRHVGARLNVDWGNFAAPQASDATNPAIQLLPLTSTGQRPVATAFASQKNPDLSIDYSNATQTTSSQTFTTVDLNLYNTTSFGGSFVSYDDVATNDKDSATTADIEFINLNTAFPNGLVFGLDNGGTDITQVKLEVTDITGKKDFVLLGGIQNFGKRWKVLASQFDDADVTKIQSIAIVAEGRHVGGKLNIDWGNFFFVPPIPADGTNPAITPVPLTSFDQDKPAFVGFASTNLTATDPALLDYSNLTLTSVSATFQQMDMNLYNTFSYGGAFVNYDNIATTDGDSATTADIETVNMVTAFPNGIVLGLDNGGTDITQVKLEMTDITGKKDYVFLTGVATTGKRWKILTSQFDEIDMTKIQTLALLVEGRHVGARLNVDWGNFAAPQGADATNPAITTVPVTSTGSRPVATAFASQQNPDLTIDYSNAVLTQGSQTFATVDMNLYNTTSFGGMFFTYDNPATNDNNVATTTDIETINLSTLFPNGIVFGLDNGGTDITQVSLEITDITGKKDSVLLGGVQSFGKRWKVLTSQFDDADVTKVQSLALVVNGRHVGGKLNIDWGNFFFVPPIPADGTNPAITTVPLATWDQDKPALVGFASFNGTNDFSSSSVNPISQTFQQIDMNLYNTFSYGGAFVNYDNPATTPAVETVNFTTAFPSGIVLGLDNGGTDITQVKLEVTDITGKKDSVYLTGVAATGKRWKILTSQFDEVDMTKIQSFSLVVEGRHVGARLNVDWGNFAAPQGSDATNPAVQKLPVNSLNNRPDTGAFSSFDPGLSDFSNSSLTLSSQTFATVDFNTYNTTSYAGMFINYDNAATNDNNATTTTDIETINLTTSFPNGLVFGLDNGGSDVTQVLLEVTDINGKKDTVLLGGIQSFGKRWKVLASQFDDVDVTKISVISLVITGRHISGKLNVDWGDFGGFVPPIPADGTNPAVTFVPLNAQGSRVVPVDFSSRGTVAGDTTSSSDLTMLSPTFGKLELALTQADSFGGFFFSYDNLATTDSNPATTTDIESINLNTAFPDGIVLGLDNGGSSLTEITLEVTDVNGKRDSVKLVGIGATGKRWKILPSQFDENVDLTKITTIAMVASGQKTGLLNIDWGIFEYIPTVSANTANPQPAITKLPKNSGNEDVELTGFASTGSTGTVNLTSKTQGTFNMNFVNAGAFGGIFVGYDNPNSTDNNPATTADIESINLSTLYPDGITLALSTNDATLTSVKFEVTDVNGNRDIIVLTGLTNTAKRWTFLPSLFDQVDITKIQTIAIIVEGQHTTGSTLSFEWGDFDFTPGV